MRAWRFKFSRYLLLGDAMALVTVLEVIGLTIAIDVRGKPHQHAIRKFDALSIPSNIETVGMDKEFIRLQEDYFASI